MQVLIVTHADARASAPRGLTEGGRLQALAAARRLRELFGSNVAIGAILSSPAVRCVETALIVASELGDSTSPIVSEALCKEIHTLKELSEGPEPASRDVLERVLAEAPKVNTLLLGVHGDLANVLSTIADLSHSATKGAWFVLRPVIAVLDYTTCGLTLRFCEGFSAGGWQNLKSPTAAYDPVA